RTTPAASAIQPRWALPLPRSRSGRTWRQSRSGERGIVLVAHARTSAYFLAKAQTGFVARMTLRSDLLPALVAFESAARHQNFAHAAEELHLTSSAVSHHVRKLEARLGVALFQRHARGVSLTAEGRHLADVASAAIHDLDGA